MIEFLHNNAGLISVSMIIYIVLYLLIVIGWFFSTDYFDKYIAWFGDDDEGPVIIFIMQTIVLMAYLAILMFTDRGYSALGALIISLIMWAIIVIPTTITGVFKMRLYLRKKRGKA